MCVFLSLVDEESDEDSKVIVKLKNNLAARRRKANKGGPN